ncbi:sperm acrosome membrane-associated protein 6 isoform X2 [Hippopotamus amphibius kiboko]|uniref:sperm acrosome membrane-associated protein 6 isoform X2 n=1 Tax=Hippopotamus amphibius kiboko TaxID=575201 RepID=UPI0025975A85|nr:sperm acrosome membrane-associated protein 6 isoform X2 [Hippopotamus amphibius kiboko]
MALPAPASTVSSALVALTVFRASAWACLLCFTSYNERLQICQIFAGLESPELGKCEEAFTDAFKGLLDTEINYDERSQLHDAFTQMTYSLQEVAAAQGSFRAAFPHAAEKMQKIILQLKEGLQEVARRFRCHGCYSTVCDLPLDCPVQDVTVTRGHQALFSCTVNFQLPKEEITYSWKFAGGLRTRDLSYFRDIPRARGYLARIRPVQPTHRGTFSCEITHDQRPLARLYFFLNVTGPPPRGETELQVSFREVLRWAPREVEVIEPWRPSLGELLARPEALTPGNQCLLAAAVALASASATVLAWLFFRWYCSGD